MSLWSEMRARSNGETIRKDDMILDKEQLATVVKEQAKDGDCNLLNILKALSKRLSLSDVLETFDVKIEDEEKLLSEEETLLLYTALILEFKLRNYVSLEDMLKKLGVHIIIDPREPERLIPPDLEKEKEFWEEKVRKNLNDEFAKKMLEEVLKRIEEWGTMLVLGLYDRAKKAIFLFPNNMKKVVKGKTTLDKLLVSTLVHEATHAYFDRTPLDELPYIYSTEEPMAEFGMLLYMKETNLLDYFKWAKDYVRGKKTCYRYGYALIMQYEKEIESSKTSRTREDLELYKAIWPSFFFTTTKTVGPYTVSGKPCKSMNQAAEEAIKTFLKNTIVTYAQLKHVFGKYVSDNVGGSRYRSVGVKTKDGIMVYRYSQFRGSGKKGENWDDFKKLCQKNGIVIA